MSRERIKDRRQIKRWTGGGLKWHRGQRKRKENPPRAAASGGDVGRTKAYQMDRSNHFQLYIKLDPLPKHGLLAVSNKQLVIVSTRSRRWSGEWGVQCWEASPQNKANKPSNKLTNRQTFLRLVSTRLRGEDIAGESRGGGLGVGLAESHHQVWQRGHYGTKPRCIHWNNT